MCKFEKKCMLPGCSRVFVSSITKKTANVFYVDYGNSETVDVLSLRALPKDMSKLRPLATPFRTSGKEK